MALSTSTTNSLERTINMSVVAADVEKDVAARLVKMARTIKMPGFRPGKVPMKLVQQQFAAQARSEAFTEAVQMQFGNVVREQHLRVAGNPKIEPLESTEPGRVAFSATFQVYPDIELADLSDATLEQAVLPVGDAEVEKTMEVLRKQRVTYSAADKKAAKEDRLTIDFRGTQEGVPFDGGVAEDFPLVLGAGSLLPEFEVSLEGMQQGESKTFPLTFPDDYQAKDLAGKTVQFEVKIKTVEAPQLPAIDEEFAKSLGVPSGDVSLLKADVRTNLEREVKKRLHARVKNEVMNLLLEKHTFDVPTSLCEQESHRLAEEALSNLASRGMNVKDIPVEPTWFLAQAERRVRLGLLVAEAVKKNELYAKPEQIRAVVEEQAQSYEDPADVVRWYYSDTQRLAQVEAMVVEDNVVDWVLRAAKVTPKTVEFDELMASN
ncbi:trigger factor [Methyloversatilis sp.]|uniref:trigger factor n=1 Tax=Methyloversatilis sp. TaxID=2569862 RepID=UPI0027355FA3|nr:trigger factor [Methyloversatilis sp.]MDP2869241.1 trigger factor [Methyloversatilis sp.]MDP3454476.1 trigger factor [Methyloversatilis sp.]MDP3576485.1 trigger factor [Methyloversatilis sp.]